MYKCSTSPNIAQDILNQTLQIANELETGNPKTNIKKMKIQDIIRIIQVDENINAIKKINTRTKFLILLILKFFSF